MAHTKVSTKYQIVIPKEIRKKMRISPGMKISIRLIDAHKAIINRTADDPVKALRGLGKDVWKSLGGGEKYIQSERNTWQKS